MKHPLAAILAVSLACASAHAAVFPQKNAKGDPRVRTVLYNTAQPINLASTGLEPLRLVFEQDEVPKSVSGMAVYFVHPDQNGAEPDRSNWPALRWEARRSANVLMLQPFGMMQPTVAFIHSVTADKLTRHYSVLLTTRDGNVLDPADPEAYFEVDWTYPHVATPDEIAAWRRRRDEQAAFGDERRARALVNEAKEAAAATVNRNYLKDPVEDEHRRCSELFPRDMYDDGHDTTMLFAPHALLPAVAVLNQDGKRADVTPFPETTPDGVKVVLPAVYKELRLYRGEKVCGVKNDGWDKDGTPRNGGTGTASPRVIRTVRGAR